MNTYSVAHRIAAADGKEQPSENARDLGDLPRSLEICNLDWLLYAYVMRKNTFVFILVVLAGSLFGRAQNPPANPTNLGSDANGNPLRKALKTGHVSNYDESKVSPYMLPDPLALSNGRVVRNADAWMNQRRPELIKLYESEIYGRV